MPSYPLKMSELEPSVSHLAQNLSLVWRSRFLRAMTLLWNPVSFKLTTKSSSGEIFDDTKEFVYKNAIRTEIKAFSQAIISGTLDPRESPSEGLDDLTILEALLQSGEVNYIVKDIEGHGP